MRIERNPWKQAYCQLDSKIARDPFLFLDRFHQVLNLLGGHVNAMDLLVVLLPSVGGLEVSILTDRARELRGQVSHVPASDVIANMSADVALVKTFLAQELALSPAEDKTLDSRSKIGGIWNSNRERSFRESVQHSSQQF